MVNRDFIADFEWSMQCAISRNKTIIPNNNFAAWFSKNMC